MAPGRVKNVGLILSPSASRKRMGEVGFASLGERARELVVYSRGSYSGTQDDTL